MPKRSILLVCLVALSACGTPQEQCIRANTQELRTLERLVSETEGNIKRGYALEQVTVSSVRWVPCLKPGPQGGAAVQGMCLEDFERIETQPKAIDLDAEKRKLASMQKKRDELARAAQAVVAECKARYPE
jgi:hypothetical protein